MGARHTRLAAALAAAWEAEVVSARRMTALAERVGDAARAGAADGAGRFLPGPCLATAGPAGGARPGAAARAARGHRRSTRTSSWSCAGRGPSPAPRPPATSPPPSWPASTRTCPPPGSASSTAPRSRTGPGSSSPWPRAALAAVGLRTPRPPRRRILGRIRLLTARRLGRRNAPHGQGELQRSHLPAGRPRAETACRASPTARAPWTASTAPRRPGGAAGRAGGPRAADERRGRGLAGLPGGAGGPERPSSRPSSRSGRRPWTPSRARCATTPQALSTKRADLRYAKDGLKKLEEKTRTWR